MRQYSFQNLQKTSVQRAGSMALTQHVTYYGLQSGFLYCNLSAGWGNSQQLCPFEPWELLFLQEREQQQKNAKLSSYLEYNFLQYLIFKICDGFVGKSTFICQNVSKFPYIQGTGTNQLLFYVRIFFNKVLISKKSSKMPFWLVCPNIFGANCKHIFTFFSPLFDFIYILGKHFLFMLLYTIV